MKQPVYFSRTLSGVVGLFTDRCLVVSLPRVDMTEEEVRDHAETLGFEYVERPKDAAA